MSNEYAVMKALRAANRSIPGSLSAAERPARQALAASTSIPYPPPSAPGQPPHRRTGHLTAMWRTAAEGLTFSASNLARYWEFLEGGTRYMKPRPSLRPGMSGPVSRIVTGKVADGIVEAELGSAGGPR